MALNAHLSGLLILLVTGLAPGIRDSLRAQDPGPRPLELKEVFKLFQIQFNKSYSNPAEHARRLDIFVHNLAMAQRLQEEDLGTAEFGVTPFSDLTEEEFGQLYGNWRAAKKDLRVGRKVRFEKQELIPPSCDWRKAPNIISPVKYQGKCNCCWAIAAAGNIEALWNIRFKQSVEVSVQELLDCGRCGDGCLGGYVWDAFITVLNYSGLASEKDYRFRGRANIHRCLAPFYKKVAWIQDYVMLPRNEHTMARYVATQGPITVLINQMLLQHYRQGIIRATPSTCDPWLVNHYVLLVGFGKEEEKKGSEKDLSQSNHLPRHSTPYWILKNSWGAHWGEQGYFRLHQGSNTCGITRSPLTACIGDPAEKQQVSCPL
ncbi:Cathepsin W [Heterocephalus glaber]|uniref:Cathepsin W n=1 Tax=Heterocephalus glaber TaxID=10181 RepID=G5B6I7_HETGA|nr:cathepsin W isoform X2 [Heterocephalus glaber]EHB04864.1 Cathepsin W [Heterocephalus glaber]